MTNRTIDPKKIILVMIPKKCDKCEHTQHAFFVNKESFDEWSCPVCEGRLDPYENLDMDSNIPATKG